MYRNFFKRFLDLILTFAAFLVAFPVFLGIIILLWFANKGKPFFFQKRPGKNEKIFRVVKFKTMNDKKNENGELLPPARRITAVGRFLRSTSLDELPQLWNVLNGDMSLIGPRPLLIEYLPLYNDLQKRRHEVRPGITGWAQVNGRNALSWEQKFEHDVWYVDNQSLWLDIKILWMTFVKVFKREGITAVGGGWTEPFRGNKN